MDRVTWYPGSGWGVVGPQAFAWLAPTWAAGDVAGAAGFGPGSALYQRGRATPNGDRRDLA